jgi:hypothetical protein
VLFEHLAYPEQAEDAFSGAQSLLVQMVVHNPKCVYLYSSLKVVWRCHSKA